MKKEYVVLNIKTNGFYDDIKQGVIKGIDPIEIAAIRINEECEVLDRYDSFVQLSYNNSLPPSVTTLTGVTKNMLEEAPDQIEAIEKLQEFSKGALIIAHSAIFHTSVINQKVKFLNTYKKATLKPITEVICTKEMFKIFKELDNLSLKSAADHLGINFSNSHKASNSATITLELFKQLLEKDIPIVIYKQNDDGKLKKTGVGSPSVKKPGKKREKGQLAAKYTDYFEKGIELTEIVEIAGVSMQTVEGHLINWINKEKSHIYAQWWDNNQIKEDDVSKIISLNKEGKLKPIKDFFGDKYTYTQIKLALKLTKS